VTSPSRVLILHDYAGGRGGAEMLAHDFRRLLGDRGIEARLLTSDADPWDTHTAPDATLRGGHDRFRPLRETYNPSAARALRRELREFRPDIVQVLMFLSQLSPSILPALAGVPTVYSINTYRAVCPTGLRWRPGAGVCTLDAGRDCRGKGCISEAGLPFRRAQLAMLGRWRGAIDRTVAPSGVMADLLARHGWPCSDVVPHGVPDHVRTEPTADEPMAAFAGRLVPEKGVEWLLEAFGETVQRIPAASLVIVGDGPLRAALEARARDLGIAERVTFSGHLPRPESQRLLERAWVQVVPSLWAEPFGLVAAEALMRATPVIASDVGGPREIVEHGRTGWIVPTGDVSALSNALATALSDHDRTRELGRAGRVDARDRFDQDRWISRYLEIYSELLGIAGGGTS